MKRGRERERERKKTQQLIAIWIIEIEREIS
jgi:hypothetical protein